MKEPVPKRRLTRRRMVKSLSLAGGAVLFNWWGCSQGDRAPAPCLETSGRKIRWLVPFPPGGGYDIYSRLLEPFFRERIGADIVVENTPGAGGVISANKLKSSEPDGLTLGILNAPGLLVAALTGETSAPNPTRDFTILARIVRNQAVWVTGINSPLRSMDDVLAEAAKRPLLFGISEAGSTNFVNTAVAAHLLGIEAEFLAGFAGSRETSLAVMRGEVDLAAFTFESILDRIEADDLRPLLQISAERLSPHASLAGVPLLGGDAGAAARRAIARQRDAGQVAADAHALIGLTAAGLLVAAPPRMNEERFRCLEQKLHEALTDAAFQAAAARANRSLDVERGDAALAEIRAAAQRAERFVPVIREAINKIRN